MGRRRWRLTPVNIDRIQEAIDMGKIDPKLPITMKTLRDAGLVDKINDGVKLLARVGVQLFTRLNETREKKCFPRP
jgi:large subunit ribosomal protein L15